MYDSILAHVSRFIPLTTEEQEYFISILKHRRLRKREMLVQAGEPCKYETYVLKGCLRAYFVDPSGNEHIAQFAIEDWWISDMASLLSGEPATLYLDALEDSEVLLIERERLLELFEKVPKFDKMFRQLLQNAFIAQQRRIVDNLCKPAKDRYLEFINKYRNIEQRVPQHQVASYLGITPEFLSQLRKQLTHFPKS